MFKSCTLQKVLSSLGAPSGAHGPTPATLVWGIHGSVPVDAPPVGAPGMMHEFATQDVAQARDSRILLRTIAQACISAEFLLASILVRVSLQSRTDCNFTPQEHEKKHPREATETPPGSRVFLQEPRPKIGGYFLIDCV